MEDIIPKPLRVVKNQSNPVHEIRSVSCSSYPSIPCRTSSLRVDWRQSSNDSRNSTKTPPFSDNPKQIKIRKRGQTNTRLSSHSQGNWKRSGSDSAASDEAEIPAFPETDCRENTKPENRIVPRFFSGWSFKSLSSKTGRFSSGQTSNSDASSASAPKMHDANDVVDKRSNLISFPSRESSNHEKTDILAPQTVPITGVDMKQTAVNPPVIGTGPDTIWTTVDISAEVSSSEPFNSSWPAPLDIVIVLDNVPHTHVGMLRQTVVSSLTVVSELTATDDRFAIVYIDKDSADSFGLLLPLGSHSFDSARAAMDKFTLRQLTVQRAGNIELHGVIQQISKMLYHSGRPTFSHVFFITATPSRQLWMPAIDRRIGFHTISPHFYFPFNGLEIPSGWHVFYDVESYDTNSDLSDKVSMVIEHIRTGVDPGVVTDLRLSLTAGDRCEIQAVLGENHLDLLRPGENWVIPIQIGVPAASIKRPLQVTNGSSWTNNHPTLNKMMVQLQELFMDFSYESITQHVLTARLEYKHSLLPTNNVVHLECFCAVVRDVHELRIVSLDT